MDKPKSTMGLKKAVLITVTAVTSVMLIAVSVIGYIISYNKVSETLSVETEQALLVCAEQVNAWLGEQGDFAVSQANAAGNIGYFVSEHTRNDEFMDSVMLLNSALLDCYTAYEDVSLYMAVTDTSTLPEGFDATSRAWYQSAKAQNKAIYTAPYVDTATGAMIFTVAAPIRENGTFAGVFGCDITLDTVIQLVSKMKLSENGYPVLIDGDGNFLVHSNSSYMPTKDGKLTSVKDAQGDYAKVMSSLGNDVSIGIYKDYDGTDKYFTFKKLDNAGWTVGYILPRNDIEGALGDLGVTFLVMFIIFFVCGVGIVFVVLLRQLSPLKKLAADAALIANGDLSVRLDYNSDDEIGVLCTEFGKCIDAMRTYTDDISNVLTAVSKGDLTVSPSVEYTGDFAKIEESMRLILDELSSIMSEIGSGSMQVLSGSNQMAEGSQSLADGTTRQASAIQQISATIAEVSTQIANTAQNAAEAGSLSKMTQDKVNQQDSEIQSMVQAMNEISSTSQEIEKIIKTIEDIAFQTNILALNAAVEAARAGEAGKGFAVVADEVRNLSGKSDEAAKSTSTLIHAAIEAVNNGSKIALATADSMKDVKDMSSQTAVLIEQIATASSEQNESIKQITSGVEQISQVIQTNSATAEETAASCQELSGQSKLLKDQVSRFRINR
ncbi:MAG: methyl-accepting chemotaxis protein [Ruminiclostridium sp.]|nr:methyl-accepting chemotaxis protein [Ruminiclostridium sp.]